MLIVSMFLSTLAGEVTNYDVFFFVCLFFYLENRTWHFIQIVSKWDNFNEMSNHVKGKDKKYNFKMSLLKDN